MNPSIQSQSSNGVNPGYDPTQAIFDESVDPDMLDQFLSKLTSSVNADSSKNGGGIDQEEIAEDDREKFEKLDQYSVENDDVVHTLQTKFNEAQQSNDYSNFENVIMELAEKIDPEFTDKIKTESSDAINNLKAASEKFENGETDINGMNDARTAALNTIKDIEYKLHNYMIKQASTQNTGGGQQRVGATAPASTGVGATAPESTEVSSTAPESTGVGAPPPSAKAGGVGDEQVDSSDTTITVGSISINGISGMDSLLSNPGGYSVLIIALMVFLSVGTLQDQILLNDSAMMSATTDDSQFLADVETAFVALDDCLPYTDKNGDPVTDPYDLVAIAMLPEDDPMYDAELTADLAPFTDFMEEYYPDEWSQMDWTVTLADDPVAYADQQNAFYEMMSGVFDAANEACEDAGSPPLTEFPTTTVTIQGSIDEDGNPSDDYIGYTCYDFDANDDGEGDFSTLSSDLDALQKALSALNSLSDTQSTQMQVDMDNKENNASLINAVLKAFTTTMSYVIVH
ncbi:MAG: hypothetical protein KBD37_06410 [Burkholderiales bacterium]|nr:hypothetical protein [Burkholderiales bacterium]